MINFNRLYHHGGDDTKSQQESADQPKQPVSSPGAAQAEPVKEEPAAATAD